MDIQIEQLHPGSQVGHFTLHERVGRGGFAKVEVTWALQQPDKAQAAMKQLRKQLQEKPQSLTPHIEKRCDAWQERVSQLS